MTRLEPQPPALITALVSARADFLRRGDIQTCVDQHVGQAWVRSGAHHVDPHHVARQKPDAAALLRMRADARHLLQAAEPALRLADDILGAEPHLVILTDATGLCLRLLAPVEQVRLDPAGNMFEGASWNERDVGSNGLGSAVATREPFVIAGPQHFADDYVNWTCMGVPLRGPAGDFVGVFNLSVRNDRMSPHTWGWTLSLAQNIEAALARSAPPSAPEELAAMDDPLRALIDVFDRFTDEVQAPANHAFVEQTRRDLAQAEAHARRRIRALHESHARLEELDERKDMALASLAHELKTPLAVIFMLLDLAERRGGGEGAETSAKVRRQATRLARMIADVADVARVKHGALAIEVEPVDLNLVIRAVVEATRPEADRRGHRLGVDLCEAAPVVNGDAGRIEQIVTNLVVNAIKYTPAGGSICVASEVDGGEAVLRVRDTGIGIAPENLERIFESFTRVVPVAGDPGGMGLGLSLVASLVRLHGGTIRARSDGPGTGSEFEVRLPLPDRSPLGDLSI
jgi:signal transduction histidine kinase